MERVFIRDIGRFSIGEVRDYPTSTWKQIAISAKRPLDAFTKPVESVVAESFKKK